MRGLMEICFWANHSIVIIISDGLVSIINNDTRLVASILLETLSWIFKDWFAFVSIGCSEKFANLVEFGIKALQACCAIRAVLLLFGPWARFGYSHDCLQEVVVVEEIRLKAAHGFDSSLHFNLGKYKLLLGDHRLLFRSNRLSSSLFVSGFFLLLYFFWSLLLRVDKQANLTHHLNEFSFA